MEKAEDLFFIIPALIFTILTALATAVLFRRKKAVPEKRAAQTDSLTPEELQSCKQQQRKESVSEFDEPETESQSEPETTNDLLRAPDSSAEQNDDEKTVPENEELSHSVETMNGEDAPLKYMPGVLRTSQMEKMMSKEELEEEQRVQQEQLAAIFRLLKENQDTFGEVTEKDMEEQLKLYSI